MLFTGVYTRGIKYLFRVTRSIIKREFMLLAYDDSSILEDSTQVYKISGTVASIKPIQIVAHVITDMRANPKYGYGDMDTMTVFMRDLKACGFFEFMNDPNIDTNQDTLYKRLEVNSQIYVEVYKAKADITSIKKIRNIDYKEFTEKDNNRTDLAVYTKSGRVRNLEQLKEIYDLSWILDENDNLKRDYRSVRTKEALAEVIQGIKNHTVISFDLETSGTDFYYYMKDWPEESQPKIMGIGISWEEGTGRYIPLVSNKFECLPYRETINLIFGLLRAKKLQGANLLFDFGVAYFFGYSLTCCFDVMQAEFDIDPTGSRGHKKLKEITRYYMGIETLELDEVLGGPIDGRLIADLDEKVITIYGCSDVDTVWGVRRAQEPYLKGKELPWKIDMQMIPIIAIEDFYGTKMDMAVWSILNDINKRDKSNVEKTIWEYLEYKVAWKTVYSMFKTNYNQELSDAEIVEVLEAQPEIKLSSLELLMKGKGKNRKRLQLSSSKDLLFIFSEILNYPLYQDFKGKISLDDDYLFKLTKVKSTTPESFLKEDLMSVSTTMTVSWVKDLPDDEKVILSKKSLEECAYPFAIMLREWRKLDKRANAFLTPIGERAVDGWYNNNTSMTAADTARFINPTQTLQGYMKKLDVTYGPDRYFVQFDLAQIEFRVMIGNATRYWKMYCKTLPEDADFDVLREKDITYLIDRLNVWWTDYHREGGSVLLGISPAKMTKKERSRVKAPHFAVPYGAEAWTIAKDKLLQAQSEAEKQAILEDTEVILMIWKRTMFPLYKYLETKRDIALQPLPDEELPPRLKGGKWGRVTNTLGRCRYYNLDYEGITDKHLAEDGKADLLFNKESGAYQEALQRNTKRIQGTIRRSAGNYPIQSDAREYFAMLMLRLFKYCKKHGLSGTGSYDTDKIIQSLMIHDENHLQVSKDIHPFKIYQILMENCLLHLDSYPTFYMGIAICDSWYESKDDKYEAPVQFVLDIVEEYKANPDKFENENWKESPKEYVLGYIHDWVSKACDKFIAEYTDDNNVFNLVKFREKNTNYFFLTKPGLYTKKFSNTESDISREELILLNHNTNPNLVVYTGERNIKMSEYIYNYDKPAMTEDGTTDLFTDDNEIDKIFDDFSVDDLDDLFDADITELKDKEADKCYWLYSEAERSFNTTAELDDINSEIDISAELPVTEHKFSGLVCINDMWILDIRGLSKQVFTSVSKFLQQYRTPKGLPVILKSEDGSIVSKIRLSRNVDLVGLQLIMEKGVTSL